MEECPFKILGLELSASKEEIDKKWKSMVREVHPDKTVGKPDAHLSKERTQILNNARKQALEMHDTDFNCHWARSKKQEDEKSFKKRVMQLVREIYDNEYQKLASSFYSDSYFQKKLHEWTPEERQEANAIVQNGTSNSRQKLVEAEQRIAKLQKEKEDQQKVVHDQMQKIQDLQTQLEARKESSKKLDDALQLMLGMQKENEEYKKNTNDQAQKIQDLQTQLISAKQTSLAQHTTASAGTEEDEDEPTAVQKSEKRKHIKLFKTTDQEAAFKQTVGEFVRSKIRTAQHTNSVLTTRQMMTSFIQNGHSTPSQLIFFKEVRAQIKDIFPDSVYKRRAASEDTTTSR